MDASGGHRESSLIPQQSVITLQLIFFLQTVTAKMVRGINTVIGLQHVTALIAQGINKVKKKTAGYNGGSGILEAAEGSPEEHQRELHSESSCRA